MDEHAAYPSGRFDVLTAFEVLEDTPEPKVTVDEMLGLCSDTEPMILCSTYTIDRLPPHDIGFWYLAPRNGHITVYTEPSLQKLFGRMGLQVHHFGNGFHLAHRGVPSWADLSFFKRFEPPPAPALRRGIRKLRRIARRITGR